MEEKFWILVETRLLKSTSRSRAARLAGRRCLRARRPASARRSSCATVTRSATWAKACCKAVANVNGEIAKAVIGARPRPAVARPEDDRSRRHAHEEPARRERHPRRVDGRRARRSSGSEETPVRAPRRGQRRAPPAGADDEHSQRRGARRFERRRAGVHGDAGWRADVRRGAANGRRDFSRAARRP